MLRQNIALILQILQQHQLSKTTHSWILPWKARLCRGSEQFWILPRSLWFVTTTGNEVENFNQNCNASFLLHKLTAWHAYHFPVFWVLISGLSFLIQLCSLRVCIRNHKKQLFVRIFKFLFYYFFLVSKVWIQKCELSSASQNTKSLGFAWKQSHATIIQI